MLHFSSPNGVKPLTFQHFGRKGYSLFAALGREVKVGVLTVATLSTAAPALAAGSHRVCLSELADSVAEGSLLAGVTLDEATAVASRAPMAADVAARTVMTFSRDDIAAAGVTSINDVLKLCAGIDVRQRGAFGVQTDISIDGGTFDQVTILLNGVNVSSPQTGHLSAEFPVTAQDIERIEVLEGPAARVYGTSAFTGAINIITRKEQRQLTLHTYGGMYGYAGGEGRISVPWRRSHNHVSGGYTRSDGATDNSQFASSRAFWQGDYQGRAISLDYQLGYSYKPYGANTFYGAGSNTQWESTEHWTAAVRMLTRAGRLNVAPTVVWNRWYDHYQWQKDAYPEGENFHQTDVYSLGLNNWIDWTTGSVSHKTSFGLEMRNEGIRSTKLGEPLEPSRWKPVHCGPADTPVVQLADATATAYYKCAASRTNVSGFLEHDVIFRRWTLSAGVLANLNTALDTRWRFYPGIDVAYRPARSWRLYGSWNMALRMPTYTDLYYSGSNIEGTRNLFPEKTSDVSVKAAYEHRGLSADASAFYSHRTNMIDWVVTSDDGIFRSGNFTLDNLGARVNASWLPRRLWGEQFPLRSLGVQYCYVHESIDYPANVLKSKYAMEYVRHKFVASADARLFAISSRGRGWGGGALNASVSWRYCDRTGSGNASYSLLDATLTWDAPHYSIYADGRNLLNKTYYDFSFIPQPGLWIVGGLRLKF